MAKSIPMDIAEIQIFQIFKWMVCFSSGLEIKSSYPSKMNYTVQNTSTYKNLFKFLYVVSMIWLGHIYTSVYM